jgi:uncharacterized protein (TIGR02466 family)
MPDTLSELQYFSCPMYMVLKKEFLQQVREVSNKYLPNDGFNKPATKMSNNYSHEVDLQDFSQYVSQTAWNILASQGYAMDSLVTYFTEMWTQEHNYMSSMETHIHGYGSQVSAFYFLDVPKDGCSFVIHDPRPAKVIIGMPPKDDKKITAASNQILFTPEEGTLIFINSWMPHSLTRSMSNESMRFVHMNLSVVQAPEPEVEIV